MKTIIVSTPDRGFIVVDCEDEQIASIENIVAIYESQFEANEGLVRASELEKKIRPIWQAAVEHEYRVRAMVLELVWEAAKPLAAIH